MIEEKDVVRLAERYKALSLGFELVLVKYSGIDKLQERIKLNNLSFIPEDNSNRFLNRGVHCPIYFGNNVSQIDWFDIQKPKPRKMTLVEIDTYLHKEGKSLCWEDYYGKLVINISMEQDEIKDKYENFGTLNSDGTFKPLPLTEDK